MKRVKWLSWLSLALIAVALLTATLSLTGCGEDFKIKDGVLKKYNGDNPVVTIPDGVTSIDNGCFDGFNPDYFVTEVVFPPSITEISSTALAYCPNATWSMSSNHPTFYLDNGNIIRRSDKCLIMANKDGTAPSYAESIAMGAYRNVVEGATITIPEGVSTIPEKALIYATVARLNTGVSVTRIESGAFSKANGTRIGEIHVTSGAQIGAGVFSDMKTDAVYITGEGATLASGAFSDVKLGRIQISSAPTIPQNAFVKVKADVVHIDGASATVETNAFYDSEIDDLYLGASIQAIRSGAINKTKIKAITVPHLGARNGVAGENDRTQILFGEIFGNEGNSMSYYATSAGSQIHGDLARIKVLGGEVRQNAFEGCYNVMTVVLGEDVHGVIGRNAFAGACQGASWELTVHLGTGITGLDENCLERAAWLTGGLILRYAGTEQEWNAIEKEEGVWNGGDKYSIHFCVPIP